MIASIAMRRAALCAVLVAGPLSINAAWGFGAVAVGQSQLPQDGVAMGASWNGVTEDAARVAALQQCLESRTPLKARALCKVVHTFSRQCVAIVADGQAGGWGWGWAVAPDLREAEGSARRLCAANSCLTTVAACDSTP